MRALGSLGPLWATLWAVFGGEDRVAIAVHALEEVFEFVLALVLMKGGLLKFCEGHFTILVTIHLWKRKPAWPLLSALPRLTAPFWTSFSEATIILINSTVAITVHPLEEFLLRLSGELGNARLNDEFLKGKWAFGGPVSANGGLLWLEFRALQLAVLVLVEALEEVLLLLLRGPLQTRVGLEFFSTDVA